MINSNIYAQLSNRKHDLQYRIAEFEKLFQDNADLKIGDSFKELESAIKISLDLQHKASFLVSLCHGTLIIYRGILRTNKVGTSEYMDAKGSIDEMQHHYDYYKNHVYTYSQRAKVISDLLKNKVMADPEIRNWD